MTDQTPPPGPPPPGPPTEPPPGPPPTWRPTPPDCDPAPEAGATRSKRNLVIGLAVFAAVWLVAMALVLPGVIDDLRGERLVAPPVAKPSGDLREVERFEDLRTDHRDDVDIDYPHTPPVGGPHDPEWLACGAYDEPIRNENAVHNLEHGAVWITYDPGLRAADIAALEELLPGDGIMSPYPGLPAPVVVTTWGTQLRLSGADDPRLPLFIERYLDETAPEPMASCRGGLSDPQGGLPGLVA